jgi:PEP-CTERM putative exosortase interaction domain
MNRILWPAALLGALLLPGVADAGPFVDNQFFSFSQNTWGADPGAGPPASLVRDDFDTLYPTGLIVGSTANKYMLFTAGDALLDYLPSTGPAAPLNAILVDPFTTISGIFGGQVAGLRLNIDFSDAGILSHPSGVSFGDLLLTGLTGNVAGLDGLSLRQFQLIANDFLGGVLEPYPIADFSAVLMLVNGAFEGGFHNAWGDAHLELPTVTAVPEPSTGVLLSLGFAVLGALPRRKLVPEVARALENLSPREFVFWQPCCDAGAV